MERLYPSWPVKVVGAEFGWADGDKGDGTAVGTDPTASIEGNVIVFNPAYNIDNLTFQTHDTKHLSECSRCIRKS